jgi:phenylpropionate dioxygenase-like ring-hydroxylating dioxygenase large terminal subunit
LDKSTATALNRRLLDHLANGTTDLAAAETRVPAAVFCDPLVFERERHALFLSTPQPVAFSGEIPETHSFLTLRVLDTPVLLTRDSEGLLQAFINACSHRGAQVATGSGKATSLVCPFHGWAYSSNGTLRGRPQDDCFASPTEDCALTRLPVSEKYGVVVLGLSPEVSRQLVTASLDEVGEELASYEFQHYRAINRRQFEVNANWKLINDLSLESYHFKTLHRDSVAEILASNAVVDTYSRHSRWAFPLKSIAKLADLSENHWPDRVEGSITYTLYPGVMLIVNSLGAQMIRAEPGATAGQSRVTYTGVYAVDCDPQQAAQAYEFGGDVFEREDLPVAEECQRGSTASGRDLLLGRNEPLLQFWHQLWRDALG